MSCGRDNYLYYESLSEPNFDCDDEDVELFLSRHFLMSSTFEVRFLLLGRTVFSGDVFSLRQCISILNVVLTCLPAAIISSGSSMLWVNLFTRFKFPRS